MTRSHPTKYDRDRIVVRKLKPTEAVDERFMDTFLCKIGLRHEGERSFYTATPEEQYLVIGGFGVLFIVFMIILINFVFSLPGLMFIIMVLGIVFMVKHKN